MYKYKVVIVFLSAIFCFSCTSELEKNFQNPPQPVRPQVWWWWLQTNTSKEAITHDLEEMKAKGLSGCLILDGGVAPFGPNKWKKKTLIGETEIRYLPTSEYEGGHLHRLPGAWSSGPESGGIWSGLPPGKRVDWDWIWGYLLARRGALPPGSPPNSDSRSWCGAKHLIQGKRLSLLLEIPQPSDHYKDVAVLAVPDREIIQKEEVLDLSSLLAEDGSIKWDPPAGNWIIYRFGYRPTGRNLAGVYYIDHLSSEVFEKHWENTVGLLLSEMSPEERLAFKYVECDSWEAGNPNWTKKFAEEFQQRRGYDLLPYLPVLAGRVLNSEEESKRIRTDYRLTISDLIADNHYGKQREMAHASGLLSYAEAAGPHQFQADVIKCVGRCDVAMGEFWMPSPHRPSPPARFLVREAATAAHTYGMKKVFAESFTSVGPNWEESPFLMKSSADQAFCDGLNWICFHTFSHRPSLEEKPGWTHSAGTHFDRTLTWWDQSGPFIDYLSRCSYMLQQGLFVADVLFYKGDGIRMKDGAQNLNAFVWEDGLKNPPPSLGKGYDYDKCNEEVLLSRLSVRDGLLVLPDGLSYRLLVLGKTTSPFPGCIT